MYVSFIKKNQVLVLYNSMLRRSIGNFNNIQEKTHRGFLSFIVIGKKTLFSIACSYWMEATASQLNLNLSCIYNSITSILFGCGYLILVVASSIGIGCWFLAWTWSLFCLCSYKIMTLYLCCHSFSSTLARTCI